MFLIRLGPVERKIWVTSRKILLGASQIQNTKVKVENVTSAFGTTVMERGKHVGILLALSSSDDEDDESSDEDISNVITSVLLIS